MTGDAGAIYGCMLAVQRSIGAIAKSQQNAHHRYNFRGIDDVLNALHPLLNEAGVFITPEVLDSEVVTFEARNKTAYRASIRMAYHFWAADGSSVTTTVKGGSIDYDDKAEQQALSQAYKAAMIQTFAIPTEGTVDSDSRSPMSEPDSRPTPQPARAVSLTQLQMSVRDNASTLQGAAREAFKSWWTDEQEWPADTTDKGTFPHWHELSDSQATVALDKVDELKNATAEQGALV